MKEKIKEIYLTDMLSDDAVDRILQAVQEHLRSEMPKEKNDAYFGQDEKCSYEVGYNQCRQEFLGIINKLN